MDYFKKILKLNDEILNEIRNVVVKNGGTITIPFFYDEEMIDEEIEQLIADGYNVQAGNVYDNVVITADTWDAEVEVVAVTIGWQYDKNAVVIVGKGQKKVSLSIQDNPFALTYLLEKIMELPWVK